ncbi:hypothetical protein MNV49_005409 [Pseudohyphozyma bogoriensis]|nr:hypothetical protein MNV49_005409 [Pseudohyphozyma bogoriensis]
MSVAGPSNPAVADTPRKLKRSRLGKKEKQVLREELEGAKVGGGAEEEERGQDVATLKRRADGLPDSEAWAWFPLADRASTTCPVVFSQDCSYCFIASGSAVRIYSVATAQLLSTLTISTPSSAASDGSLRRSKVSCLLLNPANPLQLVVGGLDGMLRLWDYREGKLLRTLDLGAPIQHAAAHSSLHDQIFVALLAVAPEGEKLKSKKSEQVEEPKAGIYSISLKPKALAEGAVSSPSTPRTPARRMRLAQPRVVRQLSISPSGAFLVSLNPTTIYVCRTADLQRGFDQHFDSPDVLTCLAFHPKETYFATGNAKGQIRLWYEIMEESESAKKRDATTSVFHWHAHPVSSLAFTPNGAYLLSGGEESVVVLWQLHTGHREFVPRVGAPIVTLSVTNAVHQEQQVVARLRDGTVVFIGSQKLKINHTISGLKADPVKLSDVTNRPNLHIPLAIQPFTKSLVIPAGHPSSLQFYSPADDAQTLEIEISPSNRVTAVGTPIEPTRVQRVAFSTPLTTGGKQAGSYWMATLDAWENGSFTPERHLKFWRHSPGETDFSLMTRIDRPHKDTITSMSFSPSSTSPLLLTTSTDGFIKIWSYLGDSWRCRTSLTYRSFVPLDAAWAADGSMFAVAHARSVSLWSLADGKLLHAFPCASIAPVSKVEFAGKEGTTLLAGGKHGTTTWDLLTFEETFNLSLDVDTLSSRPQSSFFFATEKPSREHPNAPRSTFLVDPSASTVSHRQLPFSIRQSLFLDTLLPGMSDDVSLAVVDDKGEVVLVGEALKSSFGAPTAPSALPSASTGQSRLFDEIFGSAEAAAKPIVVEATPADVVTSLGKSLAVLDAPAHTLPPARLLWRNMLGSFASKRKGGEKVEVERGEGDEAMEGVEGEVVAEPEVVYSPVDSLAEVFKTRFSIVPTDFASGGKPVVSETANAVDDAVNQAKGATVHQLDPDATPEQKAAQVAAAKAQLAPVPGAPSLRGPDVKAFKQAGGTAMPTDIGTDGSKIKVTTTAKELDSAKEKAEEEQKDVLAVDEEAKETPPGGMPNGETGAKIREIPDWFSIGWTSRNKTLFETPEEARVHSLLAEFVKDMYYGQWFHNAGIIIFAVIAAHYVTLFGGGWGWLMIILAITATYYDLSISRTRRNVRDDMSIEAALKGLKSDVESAMWINLFMTRFWLIYEPVLSQTITAVVDGILASATPAFLQSIRMTTFTLGTKPPRIVHVRTFPDTEEDVVLMDWKIAFVPNDVLDMTVAQAAKKVNSKIVVQVKFGVGPATLTHDVVVDDISFEGTMRLKLKLMNPFPHVQLVEFYFLEPPAIDLVLKPIGFDLSLLPGLKPFVMGQIHGSMAPMMYAPHVYTLDLAAMLSGAPADASVGVLALTIYNARGVKATKLGGGLPDPYVAVSIAGREELAKTATKLNTSNPQWNETKFILLKNLNDPLLLSVMDWNEHRPDNSIGMVTFDTKTLAEDGQQEGQNGEVMHDGKQRGNVKFDAVFFPVLVPKKLPDGSDEVIPETRTGVLRVTVHQAKDIAHGGSAVDPYYRLTLNDKPADRSPTIKRNPTPPWERSTELFISDKANAVIGVQVMNEAGLGESSLGYVKMTLADLLEAKEDWKPLRNSRAGRVRVTATWKPIAMTGGISGAGAYTAPIGVLRILFKRGRDLKNVEGLTGGKSDPYVRVISNGIVLARTLVIDNDLNPEWDEILYVTVKSPKDRYMVEVMDYQNTTKDRTLGSCDLAVASLLTEGEDKKNKPWLATGKRSYKEPLRSDGKKTVKGSVEFEAEFFPCAHLKSVSFHEPVSDAVVEEEEETESSGGTSPTSPTSGTTPANGSTYEEAKETKEEDPNEGIVIPRADLLRAQSGILAFQILSGKLSRKGARVEILFDDGYWPTYSTEPARSTHAVFDEIGESFIRELDYSQVIIKLNTAEKETREDVIASSTIDMNHFLEMCLDKPYSFALTDAAGGNRNSVTIMAKYVPVDIQLDLRESVNNSGNLRLEILDGSDLPAADRSGKSDPYVKLELNGADVYKSQVIKKTLHPKWNETANVPIFSRVAAKFFLEVYDWDRVGSATLLGKAPIDLAALEPIERTEVSLLLTDPKTRKQKGTVNIAMVFHPAFVIRTRQGTTNFGAAGRVATTLGGSVIGVGGNVVGGAGHLVGGAGHLVGGAVGGAGHLVGGGVGAVAGGAGSLGKGFARTLGFGKKSANGSPVIISPVSSPVSSPAPSSLKDGFFPGNTASDIPPVPAVPGYAAGSVVPPSPQPNGSGSAVLAPGSPIPSRGPGTLSVTINNVKGTGDADEKKAVAIAYLGKTYETHNHKGDPADFGQSFTVKTIDGPCPIEFTVLHKKTMGKDHPIGTATFDVWDHISPQSSPTKNLHLPLVGGTGELFVTLSWTPSSKFPTVPDDAQSVSGSVTPSQKTGKGSRLTNRFSMHRSPKIPQSEAE